MTDELKQWEYDRGYDKGKADTMKKIEDIKAEIRQKMEHKTNLSIMAYIDCLQIINKHIEKGSE